jgi:DNA-binding NtrC family response regulator
VRLVAATHRDLAVMIQEGTFRSDLYFRLRVVDVKLPPLRERGEDIEELALFLLEKICARLNRPRRTMSPGALQAIRAHTWPGNVRELDHTLERAVLMAQEGAIRAADLGLRPVPSGMPRLEELPLEEVERLLIRKALERHGGNVSQAAKALGLSRSALYRRLQHYGL